MKKTSKVVAVLLVLAMVVALPVFAGGGKDSGSATPSGSIPRNETLYFGGQQWGTVNNYNPYSGDSNNGMVMSANSQGARTLVFETLYMWDPMTGTMYPLLADGQPVWNAARTEMTIKIKKAAKWADGTPVTSADVKCTFDTNMAIPTSGGLAYRDYIDRIDVIDSNTFKLVAKTNAQGKANNPLMLNEYCVGTYVIQKAWTETLKARTNGDSIAMQQDKALDSVGSGPYKRYFDNDQKIVLIRDDNYWGKDKSMWGKLPAPKYIAHAFYSDNSAQQVAFAQGEIDVNQQFLANVQDMWEKQGLPISTYMDEPPYGICVGMPTAWYNMASYGLDNVAVRKAIAMAVDYDAININAMTGQSPTFQAVPRSVMNPTAGEQAMYDKAAIAAKGLQWVGNDIEGAKALLDKAGIKDTDGDGWRELNGKKLQYNAACPNGWTDWQAAMEIVAAAGKKIGIEITTLFPEANTYMTTMTSANQKEYDIMMWTPGTSSPSMPWGRVRGLMSSEWIGMDNNWNGNWGNWKNARADEIIKLIPHEADAAKLKALYTEATEIYLSEVPSFSLMYRPGVFHAVNESVWTNYPQSDDGRGIPPLDCTDGYGIAALYDLKLVKSK